MSEIYVGSLEKKQSQTGKEYFKGWFGKVPIIAFWGHKNPNKLNIKLDVSLAKYIDEKEDDPKNLPPQAQRNDSQQAQSEKQEPDDVPF